MFAGGVNPLVAALKAKQKADSDQESQVGEKGATCIGQSNHLKQLTLCKGAIEKCCGLPRQVVFHDREKKHYFVTTEPEKCWNLCVFVKTVPVSFHRLCCIVEPPFNINILVFLPKYSQKTLHSSPSWASYGVSFVNSKSDLQCTLAIVMPHVKKGLQGNLTEKTTYNTGLENEVASPKGKFTC